ncbi:MAG TPA: peptidase S41 [Bacteroides sp.]|nr:peptidase S41 [Bacteroides sp.]
MKTGRFFLTLSFIIVACLGGCSTKLNPNLGFEILDSTGVGPIHWDLYASVTNPEQNSIRLDTLVVRSGSYSLRIDEGTCTYVLPANYSGDTLELRGFLRTESLAEISSRGFFLNTEDGVGELNSLYTKNSKIHTDDQWHEYIIKIPFHNYAKKIVFGAYLYGAGNIWIDDFQILVDGKPLEEIRKRKVLDYPALQDSGFYSGSGISIEKLDQGMIGSLTLAGKIWGFVKYYHPSVAQGNVNMDSELFRLLPGILQNQSQDELEGLLADWLKSLGDIPECSECKVEIEGDHKLLPDLEWIADEALGEDLRTELMNILENRNQSTNYYVSVNAGIGNPIFKHENRYPEMLYPDDGYRLLALFRYWNMIQYFFPYKNLIGEDWNGILPEYIPVFLDAGDELEYRLASLHLTGRIHDTHANIRGRDSILEDYHGRYYAPVQLKFVEDKAVVTGYYHNELGPWSGLQPGDLISSIDGENVEQIISERLPYYPASNHPTKLRDIAMNLLRGSTASVMVEYTRDGIPGKATLSRYPAKQLDRSADWAVNQPESCYSLINESIGYIYLGNIKNELLEDIFNQLSDTRGIIIDIRNYPSEFVVFTMGKYLMPEPVEFVKFSNPDITYPGLFSLNDPPAVGEDYPDYYKGKVVILVNEISQSQAEYTAMALRQAPRATVLGSTTAGADGNVSGIYLPGNIYTMISGIGVYYPDGTETQRVGIIPDIELRPTIRGIREGRDEILEKAIELIENDDI